jgi:hypothetical protein
LPENARNCTIACYLRKEMTGTAWWDDISVREVRVAPMGVAVLEPNYRNTITERGPTEARIRVVLNLEDYALTNEDVAVRWRVVHGASAEAVMEGELTSLKEDEADVTIQSALLKEGAHRVAVRLTEKATGDALSEKSVPLHRMAAAGQPKCYIDVHNRLMVDGEPFFPLGMYWSGIDAEQLEIYAESAFNCLLPYGMPTGEQLDLAHAKALKVIYTVKDCYFGSKYCPSVIQSEEDEYRIVREKVEAYRSHPAVLAWYINDELSLDYLDRLVAHKEFIHSLDPDHPTFAVLYQINQIRDYMPTCDAIGTDPYPIGRAKPGQAGEWTRRTREGVFDRRPMWQVPQAFNWANYAKNEEDKKNKRAPTLEEMRSMAWQCISEGARGLIFYSWFDMRRDKTTPFDQQWPRMKTVAEEIAVLSPALLSVEEVPKITCAPNDSIHWGARQLGSTTYLFVVNATEEETTARFSLPDKPERVVLRGAGEESSGTDQALDVTLAPLAVGVYILEGLT